jgi:hypothetical protein
LRGVPEEEKIAVCTERPHKERMSKSPRVVFTFERIAEGDWQIIASREGTETQHITGLKSKAEVDEWLQGSRRIAWLRANGYAK